MQQRIFRKWSISLRMAVHDIQILGLFRPSEGVEQHQDVLMCEGILYVVPEELFGGRGIEHLPELCGLARLACKNGHQTLKALGQHSAQKRGVDGHERTDTVP